MTYSQREITYSQRENTYSSYTYIYSTYVDSNKKQFSELNQQFFSELCTPITSCPYGQDKTDS